MENKNAPDQPKPEIDSRNSATFATSVTFDIKAFDDEVHRTLTGASVAPVLRNAERIGREHGDQLWEYRILVVPEITDGEIPTLCDFIAHIDRVWNQQLALGRRGAGFLRRGRVEIRDHDARTLGGEVESTGAADPAATAGNQEPFGIECLCHGVCSTATAAWR